MSFTIDQSIAHPYGERQLTPAETAQLIARLVGREDKYVGHDPIDKTAAVLAPIAASAKAARYVGNLVPIFGHESSTTRDANFVALVDKIAAALPESARYESTLHQIDPTQLFSFATKTASFTAKEKQAATKVVTEQDKAQTDAIVGINAQQGITDPKLQQEQIDKYRKARESNVLRAAPFAVLKTQTTTPTGTTPAKAPTAAGTTPAATSSTDYSASLDNLGSLGGQALLTRADVHNLFALGGNDLGALSTVSDWETANPAKLAPGASTMQVQDPTWSELFGAMGRVGKPRTGFLGATAGGYNLPPGALGPGPGDRIASRPYTVTELINLLHTKSRDEIAALQQKLKQAGYYLATGKASGPDYVGDPNDAATADAWRRLITDSARSGTSLMTTLATRAQAARASGVVDAQGNALNEWGQTTDKFGHAVDAQGRLINPEGGLINKLGQLINDKGELIDKFGNVLNADGTAKPDIHLTDSATVRLQADQLGQSTLGRKLKPEEHAALVSFIHSLETGAQTAFAAPGSQTGENVDVASRIEEYLRREHPTEAGGKDVANQYDAFRSLLAGPGR